MTTPEELLARLVDPDAQADAIRALRRRTDAADLLIAAMRSPALPFPRGAKPLIRALSRRKSVEGLHAAVLRFSPTDPYGFHPSDLAIGALAKLGEPGVARLLGYLIEPPIPEGLGEAHRDYRRDVLTMYTLSAIKGLGAQLAPALPRLLELRGMSLRNARMHVPQAIAGACDDPEVLIDCLRWAAADRYQPVRASGLHYLGPCGHPDAIPVLVNALEDHDDNVRISAMNALFTSGEAGVDGLITALADPSVRPRAHAAALVGRLAGERGRAPLEAVAAGDRSGKVRAAAQAALDRLSAADD